MQLGTKLFKALPILIALLSLTGQSFFSGAASYYRTSVQEMTTRAAAVAEVTVLGRSYPEMPADQFQRTHVHVSINKTLKGALPAEITLDLPGGVRGNQVFIVADSADFQIGERAMVFIKEQTPGQYMVQDLGLGKFNIVSRDGQTFVESPLCPKAVQENAGADSSLLTKSIPYDVFYTLVSSYARSEEPKVSPIKLALALRDSGAHVCEPNKPCNTALDALRTADVAKQTGSWLNFGLCALFMALCAGTVVYIRRRNASAVRARASIKSVAVILTASLLAGAALGGSWSLAYVSSGPVWNLNATNNPDKVSNGQVVWKQSTSISQTNSNCMADVQASFDKWASVANSKLAFVNAGTTANVNHSSNDNVNFVAWDSTPSGDFSSNTLGICYSVYTVGNPSFFIDSDIIFNDRDFSWGPGGRGNAKSVSLHEIGHFVGLGHTTSSQTVMFPFDQGFVQLSADEISAAQTLYPGQKATPPPPAGGSVTAVASASPATGFAPLNVGFDATASVGNDTTIASYQWNFGDGNFATGATTGHVYNTPGTYTATLTVSDNNGHTDTETVIITVNGSETGGGTGGTGGGTGGTGGTGGAGGGTGGTTEVTGIPLRGSFKVVFITTGRDAFSATLLSQNIVRYNPLATNAVATPIQGTVTVAGVEFPFSYDPLKKKAFGSNGLKLVVNQRTGTVNISLKNVDLQDALAEVGAENVNSFGSVVTVPVSVVFGDGAELSLASDIPFYYFGRENKAGAGKY